MVEPRREAHARRVNAQIDQLPALDRPADDRWAVETHGLTKRFGDNVAVNDVELLVPRGCAFGYLGPNGAGKTTLIRVLLGLTHADGGTMSLLGYRVPKHRDVALARVGAIVDEPRFHGHLTGRQNLQILAAAREPAARDRIGPALERVGMGHRADDRVSKYSMGMRQRLGVAACLLGDPQLLILDEPMNGLDPAGMHEMRDMILSLVAEGRTVVLSSHLLDEVERTCDAVAIVDQGRIIRQGPIAQLLAGASLELQVECSEPDRARILLERTAIGAHLDVQPDGLGITLPAGTARDVIAEVARVLVEGGISLYRLQTGAGVARIVVLASHEPTGSCRVTTAPGIAAPPPTRGATPVGAAGDRRGSWIPTGGMIATRFMELRKRRGLMAALIGVTIGIPTIFLVIRLLAPRGGAQDVRAGRRLRHLHRARRGSALRLRFHRRRNVGLHRRIGRPHRRHVPSPCCYRPLPIGAVLGPHTRGFGDHRAVGRDRLHDRVRRVRVRGTDDAQIRRRERARQACRAAGSSSGRPTT